MTNYNTKTFNELINIKSLHLLDDFTNIYDNHKFKCLTCNHEWIDRPIKVKSYSVCPQCRLKHITSPYSDNKEHRIFVRNRIKKISAILYKGTNCQSCGLNMIEHSYAAEFHHLESDQKETEISTLYSKKWETFRNELDKCNLLCSNCHKKIHFNNTLFEQYKDVIMEKASESINSLDNPRSSI